MRQRIYSFMLVISLLIGSFYGLDGCGKKETAGTAYITQGEWITLINEAFGMYGYEETTPYYSNVTMGNPYFEQIQIAREWDVIDDSVSEFDTSAYVSYGFAAVTLVNVTGFVPKDVTSGQKISIAQDMGFIVTENEDYNIEEYITYNDAVLSLYFAKQQWANLTFDHVIEEVEFADDVVNYIEEDFTDYEIKDGKTYIPAYAYQEMQEGDIYVVPANKDNLVASAFEVQDVYQEGDYFVIENKPDTEDILEHIENLNIEETYAPDLLASNFYDGNGNLVYQGSEYAYEQKLAADKEYTAQNLLSREDDFDFSEAKAKKSKEFSFEVQGFRISGTISDKSFQFKMEKPIEWSHKTGDGNKKNEKGKAKIFYSGSVEDIGYTSDIKMSWGKLQHARASVDYKTTQQAGIEVSESVKLFRSAPYNNGNGKFITNLKKALTSDMVPGYARGAEAITGKIKIGSFDLASIGITKARLEIYVYLEANGKMSIRCTCQATKGVEYTNGKLRFINTETQTRDFFLNASLEAGLDFKFSLESFGCCVVGAELKAGLGIQANLIVYFVDEENHLIESGNLGETDIEIVKELEKNGATISLQDMQRIAEQQGGVYVGTDTTENIPLHMDNCLEVSLYVKVSLGITSDCLLAKVVKSVKDAKVEWKDDLLAVHVDDLSDLSFYGLMTGRKKTECTKHFTPFDGQEDETEMDESEENDTQTDGMKKGDYLGISQYSMSLEAGETGQIQVSVLPLGYMIEDVRFECADENIAKVSEDGTVLGIKNGVTYIKIYIPDTNFEMRCAVLVGQEEIVPLTPLKNF